MLEHLPIIILSVICFLLLILYLTTKYLYFWNLDQTQVEIRELAIPLGEVLLNARLLLPKYAQSRGKLPLIFVGHGWGMNYRLMLHWAIGLCLGGPYACLVYEARGHGKSNGKKTLNEETFSDIPKIFDYINSLQLSEVDYNKLGFFGLSFGANCGLTRAYEDSRIKAIVALSAPNDTKLNFIRKPENFIARLNMFFVNNLGVHAEKIPDKSNEYMSPKYIIQPGNDELNHRVLLINATNDPTIHYSEFEKNKELLGLDEQNAVSLAIGGHAGFQQEMIIISRMLEFFHRKFQELK